MVKEVYKDCIKLQKRKIKVLSVILAVSLLVNLVLAVMLGARLTHKAADVKQTTAATASAAIVSDNTNLYITSKEILPYGRNTIKSTKSLKKYRQKRRILLSA